MDFQYPSMKTLCLLGKLTASSLETTCKGGNIHSKEIATKIVYNTRKTSRSNKDKTRKVRMELKIKLQESKPENKHTGNFTALEITEALKEMKIGKAACLDTI